MKHYEILLFDVDGTLLDFDRAEEEGIEGLLNYYQVPATQENKGKYRVLNKKYWEMLERGEITRERLLGKRFEDFFGSFGISVDGAATDGLYRQYLNNSAVLIDGAIGLLESLKKNHTLYVITNGVAATQYNRLAKSGLDQYFDGIFISEEAGSQKPQNEFFEFCFGKMGRRDVENMLVIGDSLTSDIRGGNNAGIDTLWFNPHGQKNTAGVHVDYEAGTLKEIGEMLVK